MKTRGKRSPNRSMLPAALFLIFLAASIAASCRMNPAIVDFELNDIPDITGDAPKNVILVIGDGMGPAQIEAGGIASNGSAGTLSFEDTEDFPYTASMGTDNVYGQITDSAASATAMATGEKVENGVISLHIPGTGWSLPTLAEMARNDGKAIGLVTTDSVYSATPAAFAVHRDHRHDYAEIIGMMLEFKPEVLFGGGKDLSGGETPGPTAAEQEAYAWILEDDSALGLHDTGNSPVFGRFGDDIMPYVEEGGRGDLPGLDHMVEVALDVLDDDPDGFFLLVENELTDEACHLNDIGKLVEEVEALDLAVEVVLQWAADRVDDDTLIIVTADHETGGLDVTGGLDGDGLPNVTWSTSGHTAREVLLFARGPDSETFDLVLENVDIHRIISRYYQ